MAVRHVIWDWNGTLLDDLAIVIEALNVGIGKLGLGPIDEDEYRSHFTRPVRAFYDSLFGRPLADVEWRLLNKTFHDEYFLRVGRAELAVDAIEALTRVDDLSWTQSLLSMTVHDRLVKVVQSHGVLDRFTLLDGLREATGGYKARHLKEHMISLGIGPQDAVVIGDTPDDAVAARGVGTGIILYDGGSHHLSKLEGMAVPVADTLVEAVEIAMRTS